MKASTIILFIPTIILILCVGGGALVILALSRMEPADFWLTLTIAALGALFFFIIDPPSRRSR